MTRPRVTLKLATSLDGRIATASGESKWITGEPAREQVHRLRAMHPMILVGVDTAIADDPELTVRLPGFSGAQPTRVILDSRQRLPSASKLVASADRIDTVVVTVTPPAVRLTDAGVTVLQVPEKDGRPDLVATLDALAAHGRERGRTRGVATGGEVLVEGGGQVAASFIEAGLVDAVEWFRAPIVLGAEGRAAIGGFVLKELSGAPRFRRVAVEPLGDDLWERYERA